MPVPAFRFPNPPSPPPHLSLSLSLPLSLSIPLLSSSVPISFFLFLSRSSSALQCFLFLTHIPLVSDIPFGDDDTSFGSCMKKMKAGARRVVVTRAGSTVGRDILPHLDLSGVNENSLLIISVTLVELYKKRLHKKKKKANSETVVAAGAVETKKQEEDKPKVVEEEEKVVEETTLEKTLSSYSSLGETVDVLPGTQAKVVKHALKSMFDSIVEQFGLNDDEDEGDEEGEEREKEMTPLTKEAVREALMTGMRDSLEAFGNTNSKPVPGTLTSVRTAFDSFSTLFGQLQEEGTVVYIVCVAFFCFLLSFVSHISSRLP